MLNSKAISDLLSRNTDERLCKRWFLMTLNGTLLAYNRSVNIRDLRRQAAMATLSWQEQQQIMSQGAADANGVGMGRGDSAQLRTLTIESESSNLIISRIHAQLLLVLEGGLPRRRSLVEPRIIPESVNVPPSHASEANNHDAAAESSVLPTANSTTNKATATTVLGLQRRKFDALATVIANDLDATGFKMPDLSIARVL